MRKIILILLAAMLSFGAGCQKEEGLPAYMVTDEDEIAQCRELLNISTDTGGFSYGYVYYKADINDDAQYEVLLTYLYGSGIISSCIQCYEQSSQDISVIDERMIKDYTFFLYDDELYIISVQSYFSSLYAPPKALRPILINNQLAYVGLDEELEEEVLDKFSEQDYFMPLPM